MRCPSLQCKWASARHDLLYMMLHVIWQSHLGAVQNAVCLGNACWCRKTLRQHASIAAAGRRLKITSRLLLRISKCTLCMLLELWKLSYLELERVEELTCSLSDHLSTNQNIRISVWEISRRATIQQNALKLTTRALLGTGQLQPRDVSRLLTPTCMHNACVCVCAQVL